MPAPALTEDPLLGLALGHYRIVEKIGSGGMGVVYRARDEHLDREVAIKVLPLGTLADEPSRRRFRKEALALSKLNHPNIATIYDFDTQDDVDFLAMEYIAGITLSEKLATGPLAEKEVIALGTQLAEGLSAAHEHAVIHRDLKPANLRLTGDGRLKILDFGLAKLRQPATETAVTEGTLESRGITGTLPYMAPEQVLGGEIDARTDIHAAGLVLYEMATGRRPFAEVESWQMIGAILHRPPPAPNTINRKLSPELERIIGKCLEKEPEKRYESAKELAIDLRRLETGAPSAVQPAARPVRWLSMKWIGLGLGILASVVALVFAFNIGNWRGRVLGRPAAPRIESLAVLPLVNLSGDPQQEYFTDGMTEALITELSQISSLKVISRTSVMHYKGSSTALPQIGHELSVDGVIEGSVLRSGDRVRITAQLIYAPSDTHVWAKSYERDLHEVLRLQSEVAQAIASEVRARVTPEERTRLASARPVNPEAYELYLKGRYYWNKGTEEGGKRSIEYFQQAIDKDPSYGLAYAGLASAYSLLYSFAWLPPREAVPKLKAAALKALEIDDHLAQAHALMGYASFSYDFDWPAAERHFERANALDPSFQGLQAVYLISLGRSDEALAVGKRALDLDPLSLFENWRVAREFYMTRHYDESIEQCKKTLDMDPNFPLAHWQLGQAYAEKGMYREAIGELEKNRALTRNTPSSLAYLGNILARAGRRSEALEVLEQLHTISQQKYAYALGFARVYAGLGDKDNAFKWLQAAYEERSTALFFLKVDPDWDPIRSDPRFQDLLRRMNFPQ
jgi:serine/threonine-protein kinase